MININALYRLLLHSGAARSSAVQLFALSVFLLLHLSNSLRICGEYCGENWCNGKDIPESECDTSVSPNREVFKTDECCMHHDKCCGHGDRKTCNDILINCIKNKISSDEIKSKYKRDPENHLIKTVLDYHLRSHRAEFESKFFKASSTAERPASVTRGLEEVLGPKSTVLRTPARGTESRSPLRTNESYIDWFYSHFFDPILCGTNLNSTYVISDFFESMNILGSIFGYSQCCGTIC